MTDFTASLDGLTPASYDLLISLIKDAPNWEGQPLIDITKEQRGNLSDLKRRGFLDTFREEGCMFAIFTPLGAAFAADVFGINVK
jgi:hypothetical protein